MTSSQHEYKSMRRDIAFANRMGEWVFNRTNAQNFHTEFQRACSGEGVCFVAGTPILIGEETLLPMMSQSDVVPVPHGASFWNTLGLTCLVAGLAPLVVTGRRNSDDERRRTRDFLFAGPDEFDPFSPDQEPRDDALPRLPDPEFNALCDRLFGGEELAWDASGGERAGAGWDRTAAREPGCHGQLAARVDAAAPHARERQVAMLKKPRAWPVRAGSAAASEQPGARGAIRTTRSASSPRHATTAWVLLCALLAGCCFWLGLGKQSPPQGVRHASAGALALPAPQTRPIEAVRVGQRVLARNPELGETERFASTAVDSATWRKLRLLADNRWEDGTVDPVEVETLQPPEWITRHGARVGALVPIPLDLVEMGLPDGMHARVVANDPCPPIEPGPGKVVLTTVTHLNRDVWELTLTDDRGQRERVRPTGLHKFYSQSRQAWVSVRDLQPGEQLGGIHRPLTVAAVRPIPGVHRVYNMTVEGEHVYHVSPLAVVAHNNECAANATSERWPSTPQEMDQLLGVPGTRIPDTATTPGRGKVVWQPNEQTKIVFEQHPYHPNAPGWHRGPHWHLDTPAGRHWRFVPGDPIPGM
ncbi:hypothetical protein [Thermopirellula anaerolimosa]